MGEVVSLDSRRQNPHLSGEAICGQCRYEWVAVTPVGTVVMECPKCGCLKGMMKGWCAPENGALWHCNCGCEFFVYVKDGGMMCTNCGDWQNGYF